MVDLVILGTIGIDTLETPHGKAENVLGGSATFSSFAASFFCKPGIVSIVGDDFPKEHEELLKSRGICLLGIDKKGKTFRWHGKYDDVNEAKTLKTELNAILSFEGNVPDEYKGARYLFLGNLDPDIQLKVLNQMKNPKLVVMDTMNMWIQEKKAKLLEVISKANVLLINEGEAKLLFGTNNLVKAAKAALELGPGAIVIKKGEHGALMFTKNSHFNAPAYPVENVKDPTGCGDSFGGTFIAYLASTDDISEKNMRKALIYATSVASHNVEGFSLNNLKQITKEHIEERVHHLKQIRDF
jgi:ribokinase